MSTRLTFSLFGDDTSCFFEGTDLPDMCTQLSTEMNQLSTWFKTNRLSLNVSKKNCMIFDVVQINLITTESILITL